MARQKDKQFSLPRNIRQMGNFGDSYKIYVEDFVYTYVHQFLHRKNGEAIIAVLLGETFSREGKQYVFISGAQNVDVSRIKEMGEDKNTDKQQEFWGSVYQGIKQYFSDREILGWYVSLDHSGLKIGQELQQFFQKTGDRGSRFLYYEDFAEKTEAFFVQEQHTLQRLSGYAIYYEKNPQMQEFLIAEREKEKPKISRTAAAEKRQDDVAQNYRAIMNKLNEKPPKKKVQPFVYVAGIAVLAVVTATGITQIGNYQSMKTLQMTLQTLSGAVLPGGAESDPAQDADGESAETAGAQTEDFDAQAEPNQETAQEPKQAEDGGTDREMEGAAADGQAGTDGTNDGSFAQTAQASGEPEETEQPQQPEESGGGAKEAAAQEQNYYTVQKGDSLAAISKKLYQTYNMVDEICELNQIENMDMIYEGQKLLLP